SGMLSWSDALSVQDRWDVVRYLWTLAQPATVVERGQTVLGTACPTCAATLTESPSGLARQSDGDLRAALGAGGAAAQFVALDPTAGDAVGGALRARAFDGLVAPTTAAPAVSSARSAREAFGEVHALLDDVVAARRQGDAAVTALATDAYMRFEPFEKRLG